MELIGFECIGGGIPRWEGPACTAESVTRKAEGEVCICTRNLAGTEGEERAGEEETTGDFSFRNKCFVETFSLELPNLTKAEKIVSQTSKL